MCLSSFKQNLVSTTDFHENQSPASPVMWTDRYDEADSRLSQFLNIPVKRKTVKCKQGGSETVRTDCAAIRGYTSVMATWNFTYFLIQGVISF